MEPNSSPEFEQPQELLYNDNKLEHIQIDMSKQTPLNDPNCDHDYKLDPTDEDSTFAKVYKCQKCIHGYFEAL